MNGPRMLSEGHLIWEQTHPIDWLRLEYSLRRSKNSHYSLRAFARFLKVPSGPLSEILAKKRNLTPELGDKIATRLGYGPEEKKKFLSLIKKQKRPAQPEPPEAEDASFRQIELDTFAVMSDWYYFAILSLMETDGFIHDEKWMAARLRVSAIEIRNALECLSRLGLVEEVNGKWIGTGNWATPQNIPSLAGRKFERQGMEKAIRALDEVPIEERDMTSITMAVDPQKIPQAKEMIRRFRRTLSKFMETGRRTEVYRLNVQLLPLTEKIP
jgi:uncharacterized protein (TIGR02147 family)